MGPRDRQGPRRCGFRWQAAAADPDDLFFIRQYGLKNTGTRSFAGIQGKAGADIEAVEAWGTQSR